MISHSILVAEVQTLYISMFHQVEHVLFLRQQKKDILSMDGTQQNLAELKEVTQAQVTRHRKQKHYMHNGLRQQTII